jgi:hypothetical protein
MDWARNLSTFHEGDIVTSGAQNAYLGLNWNEGMPFSQWHNSPPGCRLPNPSAETIATFGRKPRN